MLIDLSSWYKDALVPRVELIRSAIDNCLELEFLYYSPSGESARTIEPYYLIFRWSSWYVWGWCRRPVPLPDLHNKQIFPGGIRVKALFDAVCKWRLVEDFGTGCFTQQEDGRLLFHADYTHKENLVTWLLSFRDQVELLEPEEIREELLEALKNTLKKYEKV